MLILLQLCRIASDSYVYQSKELVVKNVNNLTYAGTGVNYDAMDPFKRACQIAAVKTATQLIPLNIRELSWSRGESAYLMRLPNGNIIGHVEEGLGTKNLIADAMFNITGDSYYDQCAQDTVAMIVNDMITLGVMPTSVAMHLAVGSSDWFNNKKRSDDLIRGWAAACEMAECSWGCGETPTLKGIIEPGTSLLSGSAVGYCSDERSLLKSSNIKDGDSILFIESSGVHANGLTLARKIADNLPNGYATLLPDGTMYGETLLCPTHIYVPILRGYFAMEEIHYAVNITGHGWRKLMRATEIFEYVIHTLPWQQPIFDFIAEHGPVEEREMYSNYNMGAGFALFVNRDSVKEILAYIQSLGFRAHQAGYIRASTQKRVIIEPKGIVFEADTLQVR